MHELPLLSRAGKMHLRPHQQLSCKALVPLLQKSSIVCVQPKPHPLPSDQVVSGLFYFGKIFRLQSTLLDSVFQEIIILLS